MTLESNPTSARKELNGKSYYQLTGGKYDFAKYVKEVNGEILIGYQLRYVLIIDKNSKLNCQILPFSKIDEMGAGMYKGEKITMAERQQQAQLHHKGDGEPIQVSGAFDSTAALNKQCLNSE